MAVLTLEGTYRDGKVELDEMPGVDEARVLVTFLPETPPEAEADRREQLRRRFLARMRRGVDFGTEPLPTREDLYAERTRWPR